MIYVDLDDVKKYEQILSDTAAPIADRIDSLFCLKAFPGVEAVDALARSFYKEPKSELLKHEICYCLGQMNKTEEHVKKIKVFLEDVIDEKNKYQEIVVHEAVEALGNLDDENAGKLLEKYENANHKDSQMLYETCFLAQKLINWRVETENGKEEGLDFTTLNYKTNDPAPPFPLSSYFHLTKDGLDGKADEFEGAQASMIMKFDKVFGSIKELEEMLVDKKGEFDLFERYRSLFTLREINSKDSLIAICQTLLKENMATCGALLKHEVAYVLA